MNSYNENLHSSVLDTLQQQDLDLKKIKSEANAAMFSLYYAQDAMLTATDTYAEAKSKQDAAEKRKVQAVDDSNISNNLLKSATQANQYVQQSITNTAVAAARIQDAAKAIVKLASDIGSVFNMAGALDDRSEILIQATEANKLIKDVAYQAESASELAMDASVSTSEVAASTLLDKAKSNNKSMNDLLAIIKTDYDNKSQGVSVANTALASDRVNEKSAEGVYEDIDVIYQATKSAYLQTNQGLNVGLTAFPEKGAEDTRFHVQFECIRTPFKERQKGDPTSKDPIYHFPVEHYYLFMVKDTQKNTFSIANAESIIDDPENRCIQLDDLIPLPVPLSQGDSPYLFDRSFDYTKIYVHAEDSVYALKDSDGDPVKNGINYVVFIAASYYVDYKKALNTFDDFLSAPSASFAFTYPFHTAYDIVQQTAAVPSAPDTVVKVPALINGFSFLVREEEKGRADLVEYRCILLPLNNYHQVTSADATFLSQLDALKKLKWHWIKKYKAPPGEGAAPDTTEKDPDTGSNPLNEIKEAIKYLQNVWAELENIRTELQINILDRQAKINTGTSKHHIGNGQNLAIEQYIQSTSRQQEIDEQCNHNAMEDEGKKEDEQVLYTSIISDKDLSDMAEKIYDEWKQTKKLQYLDPPEVRENDIQYILLFLQKYMYQWALHQLTIEESMMEEEITIYGNIYDQQIDFIFKLAIAEQVAIPNYKPASFDSKQGPFISMHTGHWNVTFDTGSTDNFGNLLQPGKFYLPVVLSVCKDNSQASAYTNTWSGFRTSPSYFQQPFECMTETA